MKPAGIDPLEAGETDSDSLIGSDAGKKVDADSAGAHQEPTTPRRGRTVHDVQMNLIPASTLNSPAKTPSQHSAGNPFGLTDHEMEIAEACCERDDYMFVFLKKEYKRLLEETEQRILNEEPDKVNRKYVKDNLIRKVIADPDRLRVSHFFEWLTTTEPMTRLQTRKNTKETVATWASRLEDRITPRESNYFHSLVTAWVDLLACVEDHMKKAPFYKPFQIIAEFIDTCEEIYEKDKALGGTELDPMSDEKYQSEVQELQRHWSTTKYRGNTAHVLLNILRYWEKEVDLKQKEIYAKFMPVMNSSGLGKSKAVDQLGELGMLVITVILRNSKRDAGFPPGDPEVFDFLYDKIGFCVNIWQSNCLAYAFVEGTFLAVADWAAEAGFIIKTGGETDSASTYDRAPGYDFVKMSKRWRSDMMPVPMGNTGKRTIDGQPKRATMNRLAEMIARTRSSAKEKFIKKLVDHAKDAYRTLADIPPPEVKTDEKELPKREDFMLRDVIVKRTTNLRALFECLIQDTSENFIVLALDEAGYLFENDFVAKEDIDESNREQKGILYYNIRRVFGGLLGYKFPVWCIPLSTKSNLSDLAPAQLVDPSLRISGDTTSRIPPFTSFPVDITMREHLCVNRTGCLQKSLTDFQTLSHLKTIGRVLWDKFGERNETNTDFNSTNKFILHKLLGEEPALFARQLKVTNSSGEDKPLIQKCFAVLAARLCLDDFSTTVEARELVKQSILSHLRLLQSFDQATSTAVSITPSEPIVAQAVSGLLHQEKLWSQVIRIAHHHLFRPGIISRGVKGEFFVLLLLILARDIAVNPEYRRSIHSAKPLSPRPLTPLSFPAAKPFLLLDFLEVLLEKSFSTVIFESKKKGSPTTMREAFKEARLNFSHWTRASEHLYGDKEAKNTSHGDSIRKQRDLLAENEFLHLSMWRQAGIIMAPNQPEWDAVLPIYFGDPAKSVDQAQLSCLFIQTKNVQEGYIPSRSEAKQGAAGGKGFFQTNFSQFPGIRPTVPKIGLIFNVGYKGNPQVRVLEHEESNVWYFDIRGNNNKLFKCLNDPHYGGTGLSVECTALMEYIIPVLGLSKEQEMIVESYEPFSKITFAGQAGEEEMVRG